MKKSRFASYRKLKNIVTKGDIDFQVHLTFSNSVPLSNSIAISKGAFTTGPRAEATKYRYSCDR